MQLPQDFAQRRWAGHRDHQLAVNRDQGPQPPISEVRRVPAFAGRRLTVRDRRGAMEWRVGPWPDAGAAGCLAAIATAHGDRESDGPKRYPLRHLLSLKSAFRWLLHRGPPSDPRGA